MRAPAFLSKALGILQQRGEQRDEPNGERSMLPCVTAFNAITGRTGDEVVTEEEGWLFMSILKKVRTQKGAYDEDSYVDDINYSALQAEAARHARYKNGS